MIVGSLSPSAPRPTASVRAEPAPASLLAVVGDPCLRDFLLELALERGYGVYCADGALEALGVLGREAPGAVLADLDMTNGAGVRFLDVFLRLRRQPRVLCAAVTADAQLSVPHEMVLLHRPTLEDVAALLAAHFERRPTA